MEFLTVLATFCVAVLIVLPTCASSDLQESIKQNGNFAAHEQAKFTLPNILPRKLKLQQEVVTIFDDKDIVPRNELMEASSAGADKKKVEGEKEEKMVDTKRENVEGQNKSSSSADYSTMDYAWLKRRRPIHNKHVPVNPAP